MTKTIRRILSWGSTIALMGALWWFVLPPQLGGRTVFLTTHGVSMQPLLYDGDLAILHKQSSYAVGDIIEYHSDALNAPVLHRIVSIDSGVISTEGDNNGFVDLDHPTKNEINGKMAHHYHGMGNYITWLKSTPVRIIGFVLIGLAIFGLLKPHHHHASKSKTGNGAKTLKERLHRNRGRLLADLDVPQRTPGSTGIHRAWVLISVAATFTIVFGAITAVSFSSRLKPPGIHQVPYKMAGQFAYSAQATGGDLVYRDSQVSTGDPIYLAMVQNVFFTFQYDFTSPAKFRGGGTVSFEAVLKGPSGWTHPITLANPTPFTGTSSRASAVIDFNQLHNLVMQIDHLTKITDSNYTLTLQPVIHPQGVVEGTKFDDIFEPTLALSIDASQAKVPNNSPPTTGPHGSGGPVLTGMQSGKDGFLTLSPSAPARLRALGITFGVTSLRIFGGAGVLFGLVVLTLLAAASLRKGESTSVPPSPVVDSHENVVARYHELFVPVTGWGLVDNTANVVEMPSLQALVRVAEQHGALILHQEGETEVFVVNTENTTYKYKHLLVRTAEERFGVASQVAHPQAAQS